MKLHIRNWHAHIYFDPQSPERDRALALRERIRGHFDVSVGHFHERPVGPHPRGSFQILLDPELCGAVIPWLTLNRDGLTVFVHPTTCADLPDHRDRAIWLGPSETLDLSVLT